MAYHSTAGTADNTADFMATMQSFLVNTVGWNLHDDGSAAASPFFVFNSSGESGREAVCLYLNRNATANRLYIRAYQSWDNQAHQGNNGAYHASYVYSRTSEIPFLFWIFADLDHWFLVTKVGATYYGQYSGLIQRNWSSDLALTQATVGRGNNVTVPVDDARFLETGRDYFLAGTSEFERVTVTAVDTDATPHQVTLAALPTDFAEGARLGEDPLPVIVSRHNTPGPFYALNWASGYSSTSGQSGDCRSVESTIADWSGGDDRFGLTMMYPWFVAHGSSGVAENRGQLIGVYKIGTNNVDSEDTILHAGTQYRVFNLNGAGFCAVRT